MLHGFARDVEQEAHRVRRRIARGKPEMPAGVSKRSRRSRVRTMSAATSGSGAEPNRPLQQAKRSIVIACFER